MSEIRYSVPAISCDHCVNSISAEVRKVPGVRDVNVSVADHSVTVLGDGLDDAALRAAIDEAGYDVKD